MSSCAVADIGCTQQTYIGKSLPRDKRHQSKYDDDSIDQHRPIRRLWSWIWFRREEYKHERQPQKAQRDYVDRQASSTKRKSGRWKFVAGDLAVGNAGNRDDVAAQNGTSTE